MHNVVLAKEQINRAWNRIGVQSPETEPCIYGNLIYNTAPQISGE